MQKVAILYDASQAVLSAVDLDDVLQQILAILRDYFHVQNLTILLLDEQKKALVPCLQAGGDTKQSSSIPLDSGIVGASIRQKRPVYVPDVTQDSRCVPISNSARSQLAVPLMVRENVVG